MCEHMQEGWRAAVLYMYEHMQEGWRTDSTEVSSLRIARRLRASNAASQAWWLALYLLSYVTASTRNSVRSLAITAFLIPLSLTIEATSVSPQHSPLSSNL